MRLSLMQSLGFHTISPQKPWQYSQKRFSAKQLYKALAYISKAAFFDRNAFLCLLLKILHPLL